MAKKDKADKDRGEKKKGKKKEPPASGVLSAAVTQVARALRTRLSHGLAQSGLYPGQDGVVQLLAQDDGQTPGALAQQLGVKAPTMTGPTEFECRHRADLPGVLKSWIVCNPVKARRLHFRQCTDARDDRLTAPDVKVCDSGRARDRIGRIGTRMKERARSVLRQMRIENGIRAQRRGKRNGAARQPLCDTDDIGRDVRLF